MVYGNINIYIYKDWKTSLKDVYKFLSKKREKGMSFSKKVKGIYINLELTFYLEDGIYRRLKVPEDNISRNPSTEITLRSPSQCSLYLCFRKKVR